jgi:hypothetical protein
MLSEDYVVELLKKLPVYHRRIYEYQQIAGAQEPELQLLLMAIDAVLDDWFVYTATETGIARMEKIAGITPDASIDLETRRYRLLAKMTEKIPYTDETLEQRLGALAGDDNYSIVRDYINYKIQVNTTVTDRGSFDEICNALVKMIPCNLILEVLNTITESKETSIFYGICVSTAMGYMITHDVKLDDSLKMDLNSAVGLSEASSYRVTHDLKETGTSKLGIYEGMGVGVAESKTITHDNTFAETLSGNSTVAFPVTTATVITINQTEKE